MKETQGFEVNRCTKQDI